MPQGLNQSTRKEKVLLKSAVWLSHNIISRALCLNNALPLRLRHAPTQSKTQRMQFRFELLIHTHRAHMACVSTPIMSQEPAANVPVMRLA